MAESHQKATVGQEDNRIGKKPVTTAGIISMMAYLIIFSGFLLYSIILFWPSLPLSEAANSNQSITFLFSTFSITGEKSTILIVIFSGALGSLVHTLRSFYRYVGNRELVWSWLAMYIMLPFVGATLGLVFYLIVRGGFFTSQVTAQQTNPFGFMAMSALAGLFSEQTILKLKQVAETLLTNREVGKNPISDEQQGDDAKKKQGE